MRNWGAEVTTIKYIVIVSADAEWEVVHKMFPDSIPQLSPFGEWFLQEYPNNLAYKPPVLYFRGGWGKVSAAASTQFLIDRWTPDLIINLGTCGGIEGKIKRGEIVLVEKTVIYDIFELMGEPDTHIEHYVTELDLAWLREPYPIPVIRASLLSGDRDLIAGDVIGLYDKYGAVAGDWESGAIAWVAKRNNIPSLILRGVTDLVGVNGGEAYDGKINIFHQNTYIIMRRLISSLPGWLSQFTQDKTT
jgi:adenosylhomocysteine nucleosidase